MKYLKQRESKEKRLEIISESYRHGNTHKTDHSCNIKHYQTQDNEINRQIATPVLHTAYQEQFRGI